MASCSKTPTDVAASERESGTSGSASDTNKSMGPPPGKKRRMKRFNDSWLTDPSFASWIAKSERSPHEARCLTCNAFLKAGRIDLLRHGSTRKHRLAAGDTTVTNVEDTEVVKKAEIRHVLDIIERNASFHSYQLQDEYTDCSGGSLRKLTLRRTKIRAIIKNVIDKTIIQKTIAVLKNKYLSILVDKSADAGGTKALCILVRYMHEGKLLTYLLDYIKVREARAESLYKYFEYCLQKYGVPIRNVIAITTDDTSVTFEKRKSFAAHALKNNPALALFPCVSHSLHLLASDACKCLPKNVLQLLQNIYTYLSRSPKRQCELQEMQQAMQLPRHKMIEPSKTKWLATSECAERVLEQWDALNKFFDQEVQKKPETSDSSTECESELSGNPSKSKGNKASEIFKELRSLYAKAYLQFLDFVLKIITKFHRIFQASDIPIYSVVKYCHKFLTEIGCNFIKYSILEHNHLHEIDPYNSENLLPLESIFINSHATRTINDIHKQARDEREKHKINEFYTTCQKFYQTAYNGAIQRLPCDDTFLKALEFLEPSIALNNDMHADQLQHVFKKFPSKFDEPKLENEWYALGFLTISDKDLTERLRQLSVQEFWYELYKVAEPGGIRPFENIADFAMTCLCFTHSNADIERFFSLVSEIKTPDRNQLEPETVAALCRVKLELKNTGRQCHNYEISDDFLENFNCGMYNKETVPNEFRSILIHKAEDASDSEGSEKDSNE